MKFVIIKLLLFATLPLFCQPADPYTNDFSDTNQKNRERKGGYGGFSLGYTQIERFDGLYIGCRGAANTRPHLLLGASLTGFFTESVFSSVLNDGWYYSTNGFYGGLLVEPLAINTSSFHLSFPLVIGGGGVAYTRDYYSLYSGSNQEYYNVDTDALLVCEPGIEAHFEFKNFTSVGLGLYYRYTSRLKLKADDGSERYLMPGDALHQFSLGVTFKVGKL